MRGRKPNPPQTAHEQAPPPPPSYLKGEARKEWVRITAILARQRVLADSDQAALVIYCQSWATYKHAQAQIDEHGSVIMSNQGTPIRNPYSTIVNQCWDRIRPLLDHFGLSPTARGRLKLDQVDEGPADPGFDLLGDLSLGVDAA